MKEKIFIFAALVVIIVLPFLDKLPIPADSIPGLYYPMKDLNLGYSHGVPVKNPLITDPVRQQFGWKWLAINELKTGKWPLWNPYNFSGTPLLANFQTSAFYPLNAIFFIPNFTAFNDLHWFAIQWSWFIYLQIILAVLFMYIYLKEIGLHKIASLTGGIIWAFCGFNLAWWEWGNVVHTILWFPLMLYAAEKVINTPTVYVVENKATRFSNLRTALTINRASLLLLFALVSSFLAGHVQTFFMEGINLGFYLLFRIPLYTFSKLKISPELTARRRRYWLQIVKVFVLLVLITSVQWLPTMDFVNKSARNIDPTAWLRKDWFYPWEHFISLLSPDFFGNPTTNNYWGVWNYGEFAAYIGILPLMFALAIIIRFIFDKFRHISPKASLSLEHRTSGESTIDILQSNAGVGFFLFCLFINIILITRNPLTESFYRYNIPFLSSTQPSRGIAIVDFSLVVLAAVGFNELLKSYFKRDENHAQFYETKTNINFSYLFTLILLGVAWFMTFIRSSLFLGVLDKAPMFDVFSVARSNLILPTALGVASFIVLRIFFKKLENEDVMNSKVASALIGFMFFLTLFDLGRYFYKFESFSSARFLYPDNAITKSLQSQPNSRYMTEDSRILAPNLNIPYQIDSAEGYDPLYLDKYGQLVGLWQRNQPDLSAFPANRILTPHTPKSIIADISATDYLVSFGDYVKYEKTSTTGETKLFKRDTALPRTIILSAMRGFKSEQDLVNYMFSSSYDPFSEGLFLMNSSSSLEIPDNGYYVFLGAHNASSKISKYSPSEIEIKANLVDAAGLLYLADTFEDGWNATIDNVPANIIRTNFAFRGVQVPQGQHTIKMSYEPRSFKTGLNLTLIGLFSLAVIILLNEYHDKSKLTK